MLISPLQEVHFKELIVLSDHAFGKGFVSEDSLQQVINSSTALGLVSTDNKKVVGYILIDSLPYKKFLNSILENRNWFQTTFKDYKNISMIRQVVVAEEYQKKGNCNPINSRCFSKIRSYSRDLLLLSLEKRK